MHKALLDLLEACDLVLNECRESLPPNACQVWSFEEGSEAHLVLSEAVEKARKYVAARQAVS